MAASVTSPRFVWMEIFMFWIAGVAGSPRPRCLSIHIATTTAATATSASPAKSARETPAFAVGSGRTADPLPDPAGVAETD